MPVADMRAQLCPECSADMHEDLQNGNIVCYDCGVTERMLMPDAPEHVDLQHASMVTRSQHKPMAYVKQLIRGYGVSCDIEAALLQSYLAVVFWSERHKPDARKSLPN